MSRWLDLARAAGSSFELPPDNPTEGDKIPKHAAEANLCPVLSGCRVKEAGVSEARASCFDAAEKCSPYHGFGVAGRVKTWTGKVVSISDWQSLSEWGRHGPGGKVWDGNARQWICARGEHDEP